FQHVDHAILHCVLHIHQADHVQRFGKAHGVVAHAVDVLFCHHKGRDHTGAVAAMHTRQLDLLHNAGDLDVVAIAGGVDVHFKGIFEEAIDQNRVLGRSSNRFTHILLKGRIVINDRHTASTQDVGG